MKIHFRVEALLIIASMSLCRNTGILHYARERYTKTWKDLRCNWARRYGPPYYRQCIQGEPKGRCWMEDWAGDEGTPQHLGMFYEYRDDHKWDGLSRTCEDSCAGVDGPRWNAQPAKSTERQRCNGWQYIYYNREDGTYFNWGDHRNWGL